ncbi:MAG: amino acid ABC transporter substrate-binding protein [Chitinophagaceae bacterium]
MKKTWLALVMIAVVFCCQNKAALAQTDSVPKRFSIAVFTPLYLDSAFDQQGEYRYDKNFPRFISPGLEFYEGIKLAVDSLRTEKLQLDVDIYDTKSASLTLQQQLSSPAMEHAGLIIGHVTPAEAKILAEAALKKNIPFINANLPNDAGISNNPSLVILNTTLQTHCDLIYRFLQRNYATSPVVIFRKKGSMEDRLQSYFSDAEKNTAGVKLKVKFVLLDDSKPFDVTQYLDSTKQSVSVVGSLDETFGKTIAQQLSTASKSYQGIVVGMPTWDAITDFNRSEYKGLTIVYSTPFYNAKTDKTSLGIINYFKTALYARPSDMVFRGYECLYRFGKLLAEKGSSLNTSIGEKKYKVFTDWDIQPVLDKQTLSLDHFENKKLYFVKKVDGNIKQVL